MNLVKTSQRALPRSRMLLLDICAHWSGTCAGTASLKFAFPQLLEATKGALMEAVLATFLTQNAVVQCSKVSLTSWAVFAFIQLLRNGHGLVRGEAKLGGGLLLQCGGDEGGRGLPRHIPVGGGGHLHSPPTT